MSHLANHALFLLVSLSSMACSGESSPSPSGSGGAGASATGGSATGGIATGGSATGGSATGGSAAGGNSSGGSATGGSSVIGGDSGGPEACFEGLEPATGQRLEIQRFRNSDSSLRLWRARETTPEPTVGETFAFKLVRFWVDSERDPDTCVRDPSAFEYQYAHHNWHEEWKATTANSVYIGSERFEFDQETRWTDTLEIVTVTGDSVARDISLIDDGCISKPLDYNVCMLRDRLDTNE